MPISAEGSQYRLRTLDELMSYEAPTALLEGLLFEDSIALLVGPSGSYKTSIAIEIALCIQEGLPWMGRTTKQRNVALFNGEDGRGLKGRFAAAMQHHQIPQSGVLFDLSVPDLRNSDDLERRIEAMAGKDIGFVVIDTLAHAMVGIDENAAKDMGRVIQGLSRIREELGATVLAVHHTGKDPYRGARGSSALQAAVDTELQVSLANGKGVLLRAAKQRHGPSGDQLHIDVQTTYVGDHSACVLFPGQLTGSKSVPSGSKAREHAAYEALLELEKGRAVVPKEELRERLKVDPLFFDDSCTPNTFSQRVHRSLESLVEVGKITVMGSLIALEPPDLAERLARQDQHDMTDSTL